MTASAVIGRRPYAMYDAEYHFGLQADNSLLSVAIANTAKLNAALAEMKPFGYLALEKGEPTSILRPIQFAAKEFFFSGVIKDNPRVGSVLLGGGGGSYALPTSEYASLGDLGGAVTRLTRIDGEDGGPVLRLRGANSVVDGFDIKGRRWDTTSGYTGTRSEACIEVEGRTSPATGGHLIRNCSLSEATHGIRVLAGYYNDVDVFVSDEQNGGLGRVEGVNFAGVESCFRSLNQAAVGWNFNNLWLRQTAEDETVVFDIVRGGYVTAKNLILDHNQVTLFKVRDYLANVARLTCENFRWGEYSDGADYLSLFNYDGSATDAAALQWSVRASGGIANTAYAPGYDTEQLVQISSSAVGFPLHDLLFDVSNLPGQGFIRNGQWLVPTNLLLS